MHNLQHQAFPMRYAKNLAKPYAFAALQRRIKTCSKCANCKKSNQISDTLWGNPNATLLIALSWPGAALEEMAYLNTALDYYNVDKEILAFTFALHCDAHYNNKVRPPLREEAEMCAKYMHEAVETIEPLAIICLSTVSSNLFYKQNLNDSIKEVSFIQNIPIFTTYPPSYILNLYNTNNELYESKHLAFYEHIQKALDYISDTYPNLALYK